MSQVSGLPVAGILRSSDGHPVHPEHRAYHMLRLLAGSLISGWTLGLVLMTLGFLGNIEFTNSLPSSYKWIFLVGSIVGIILGAILSIAAAILRWIFPLLKRNYHPLALVRAGFIFAIFWPLISLLMWPIPLWVTAGAWIGPIAAVILAIIGARSNPHAHLVPHSSWGRALGTSIGPFLIIAILLSIIIPMYNRGLGMPTAPKLLVVALDGVDANTIRQYMFSPEADKLPALKELRLAGSFGSANPENPLIPSRLWADTMTGTSNNGILDSLSSAKDLTSTPIWDVLAWNGFKVGLFQMLPPHESPNGALFDVADPSGITPDSDPRSRTLNEVSEFGKQPGFPSLWKTPMLTLRLARLGVKLSTLSTIGKELLVEAVLQPSPRQIYASRKELQFQIECDCALALMRGYNADAAFLRFPSMGPLFIDYMRYSSQQGAGSPPADVDSSLMAGLSRVLPDSTRLLDKFISNLKPFRNENTVFCIISDHGERAAYRSGNRMPVISPSSLLEIAGWGNRAYGEKCGEVICIRLLKDIPAVEPEPVPYESVDRSAPVAELINPDALRQNSLSDLESLLRTATWRSPETPETSQSLFSITKYDDRIEVSIRENGNLTSQSIVTIGTWTDILENLIEPGEPPASFPSGPGLFIVQGPGVKATNTIDNAQILDVMPTLMHALGMPVSRELMGHSLDRIFDPAWLATHQVIFVDSYIPPTAIENAEGPAIQNPEGASIEEDNNEEGVSETEEGTENSTEDGATPSTTAPEAAGRIV
jgi:MFS family permease